jgi:Glycogen recognition site of AMP-activated protein kinase
MRCAPISLLAAAISLVRPASAHAQTDASLGVGSGTVRFPDGTSLGLLSVSPALQLVSPYRQLTVSGAITNLSQGGWYGQGRLGVWAATHPMAAHWQLAGDFGLSGTSLEGQQGTGAGQVTVEGLWAAAQWGVAAGAGGASGWIGGTAAVTAPRARVRGWWQSPSGRLALSSAVESTRFLGAWFTDLDAGLSARRDRFEVHVWASGRASAKYGSKLAALASAAWRLSPLVSLEASAGSVLPDPYQGFPRSGFFTAGVLLHFPPRARRRGGEILANGFSVTRQADGLLVRVTQRGAALVSIAGDWNGWNSVALARAGTDTWTITLPLAAGTYHFTVLVDGTPWSIPESVPTVPDGMGGRVAVLIVL